MNQVIRYALLVVCAFLLHTMDYAQSTDPADGRPPARKEHTYKTRRGVCLLPSYTKRIDGLALSLLTQNRGSAAPLSTSDTPLVINGMNLDIQPLIPAFIGIWAPLYHVFSMLKTEDSTAKAAPMFYREDSLIYITGVDLNVFGSYAGSNLRGFGYGTILNTYVVQRGVSVSVLFNDAVELHGAQLSLLGNYTRKGRGVQIGLINRCQDCDCLQIGLINRNGNSFRPLVNWRKKRLRARRS